ncbi:cell envelope integrity protein TolA [Nitrosomonas marina]|uniref:Cell division and transport-associated protein TolA n=1 Tax=Nitrosomonas marina TaxID=917 RepID=A0A1H8CJS9_9PROT|nr:cell envelope integrity protein TolA [Nitrosomonas marina]SEM95541.1 Cell division and transport-associated protein TolA [Nitrosomonas marina]
MTSAYRQHLTSSEEPRPILAGALALLVHIVFIAILIFGFNWKDEPPASMVVDIWQDLPRLAQQPVEQKAVPPVQPEQQPKPAPEVKPESRPQSSESKPEQPRPAPAQASPPPPKKPDIALKDKTEPPKTVQKVATPDLEAQRKKAQEQEAKEKAETERLQREKAEQEQREREAQKKREIEAQKQREQEEQRKRELEAQQKREQEEIARREAQQAAARAQVASEISKYKAMILAKIKSRIVMPPDLPGNPVTEFNVTLLPGGDILDARLRKSSGYPEFDSAVERAILMSRPLPLPPDPALFSEFRNLQVTVHYLE